LRSGGTFDFDFSGVLAAQFDAAVADGGDVEASEGELFDGIVGAFDEVAVDGHMPREDAPDVNSDAASEGAECSFVAAAREEIREFLRKGRDRDRVKAAEKRRRMRQRRRRSRERASTAVQSDVLVPSNVDWAEGGDVDEEGGEDKLYTEEEEAVRSASHSVADDAVLTAVAAALDKSLGLRDAAFEIEQSEIDGAPLGLFEVLVSKPRGHRIAPEQFDAAARSAKDVLERTAIDVKKVMVYTVTW
jgi:hypothetical protein